MENAVGTSPGPRSFSQLTVRSENPMRLANSPKQGFTIYFCLSLFLMQQQ